MALRNRRDQHHRDAVLLLNKHADVGLLTTNHVCGETWTYLRKKSGHASAVGFLDVIGRSTRVIATFVTEDQETKAFRWLRDRDDRVYSFVDATSFVVMKDRRIQHVLAFDGDFSAAGFTELRSGDSND